MIDSLIMVHAHEKGITVNIVNIGQINIDLMWQTLSHVTEMKVT